jgi:hypothetical protein
MGENGNLFPKVRNKTKMPTFPTPIQHSPGIPSQSNKTKRRNKRNMNKQRNVKVSLFADIILYLKDPKNSTPKLLDLINSFSNVPGYKINLKNQ